MLWSIAASEPTTLSRIYYGVVPDGFRQVTPPDSEPPRALWPGEWLQTFLVQRYDEPQEGIEIALASEGQSQSA